MSVSPAADSKKNVQVNKNDETEVSAVLNQVEQKVYLVLWKFVQFF